MPKPVPYKTVSSTCGPFLLKERKSKFLGWAFPVQTPEEAAEKIESLWKKYPDATHVCYAYRIGVEQPVVRANDDGEPSHSAGTPILHQMESEALFNLLVCVVRYYGGTKLGVGGLIHAYREAARGVLDQARKVTRVPVCILTLDFEYPLLDAAMRYISQQQLKLRSQRMELDCSLQVAVPPDQCEAIRKGFHALGIAEIRQEISY